MEYKRHISLPFFFIWCIWRAQRELIFNTVQSDILKSRIMIMAYYKESVTMVFRAPRSIRFPKALWIEFPVGFFDGDNSFGSCGSGMAIHLEHVHYF